jgi:hypothetical protein
MVARRDANSSLIELIILMQTGRSISDDHWEEIDAAHIKVWQKAKVLLRVREYTNDAVTIRIEIDWSPTLARLRLHYRTMSRLTNPAVRDKKNIRFPRRPIR